MTADKDLCVTRMQRAAWRLTLLCLLASAGVTQGFSVPRASAAAPAACTVCTGTFYGADSTILNPAITTVWPQKANSNYCGIEDAIGLVNYDNLNSGQTKRFTSNDDQVARGNYNQTVGNDPLPLPGLPQWGWAYDAQLNPPNKYGGGTNIAPDYGTDPRSVAWVTWNYSLNNRYFHDHIYSWHQDPFGQQTRQQQVGHATTLLARGLNAWNEPIIVFINGGKHAVLLSGIWSGNDIYANYPAAIQGMVYRDPMGNSNTSREELNYSYWLNGNYPGNFGNYKLWSVFYGDLNGPNQGGNTLDPEPTMGPYVPGVRYDTHWYDNLNWVQRDNIYGWNPWSGQNDAWNPDYAINAVTGEPV